MAQRSARASAVQRSCGRSASVRASECQSVRPPITTALYFPEIARRGFMVKRSPRCKGLTELPGAGQRAQLRPAPPLLLELRPQLRRPLRRLLVREAAPALRESALVRSTAIRLVSSATGTWVKSRTRDKVVVALTGDELNRQARLDSGEGQPSAHALRAAGEIADDAGAGMVAGQGTKPWKERRRISHPGRRPALRALPDDLDRDRAAREATAPSPSAPASTG